MKSVIRPLLEIALIKIILLNSNSIIFGAMGYTGRHVAKSATCMCKEQKMKFDIAGRRKETLETIVKDFTSDFGKENVPIILADTKDKESLKKMTELAKILISYCGPCRSYGEPVIKVQYILLALIILMTAEEEFTERMQLKSCSIKC